jgi:hypothetical protein
MEHSIYFLGAEAWLGSKDPSVLRSQGQLEEHGDLVERSSSSSHIRQPRGTSFGQVVLSATKDPGQRQEQMRRI